MPRRAHEKLSAAKPDGRQRLLLATSLIQLVYRLAIAAMADNLMQYIRWLVVAECVNVVLFVAVVVWALKVGRSHAAPAGPAAQRDP